MKANEAPEKIYIHSDNDVMGEVLSQKVEGDIEYTRTDAFIEKACSWLKEIFSEYENLTDYNPTEDFRNYMKGEQV